MAGGWRRQSGALVLALVALGVVAVVSEARVTARVPAPVFNQTLWPMVNGQGTTPGAEMFLTTRPFDVATKEPVRVLSVSFRHDACPVQVEGQGMILGAQISLPDSLGTPTWAGFEHVTAMPSPWLRHGYNPDFGYVEFKMLTRCALAVPSVQVTYETKSGGSGVESILTYLWIVSAAKLALPPDTNVVCGGVVSGCPQGPHWEAAVPSLRSAPTRRSVTPAV